MGIDPMPEADGFVIPAPQLKAFAAAILEAGGFTREESEITAKSLILSNLMGHDSHGIIRVVEYTSYLKSGDVVSGADLRIENETPACLTADANLGLGQVQMTRLLDILIEKARETAVSAGAMRNCGHTGRVGEWAEYVAERGLAVQITINDNGTFTAVAPPGGKQGVTSTNPIAFGFPLKNNEIFAADFATSATAMGKTRLAYLSGEQVPADQLQDAGGNPTTDPSVLYESPKGSLLPMGGPQQGYKGFSLSMLADCLSAGLSGGFTPPAPDGTKIANNVLVTIWHPDSFAGLEHMQTQAQKYIDFVRASEPIDPASPVRIPGDRAKAEKARREKEGIPLSKGALETIIKRAEKLGVPVPEEFHR